jgi:aminoglycoside 6'-N-acetyltransferase
VLPRNFHGGQLRRLLPTDLAAFQAYRSTPELSRYQGWSPMPEAEAAAFLAEMADAPLFTPGKWIQLGIAHAEDDHLIGDIGIFVSEDGVTAEIGFTLALTAQGRGIATAAVREAVELLFAATEVQRALGITDSRNAASVRLLERVGFQYQGSRAAVFRGEPCSEHVYVLLHQ